VSDGCFLAAGAALFPGSVVGAGAEVRVHGVVQVNTVVPPGQTVPIGWVAVGDPARVFPPGQHEQIWAIQETLDFPGTVYGVARGAAATGRMRQQAAWYGSRHDDRQLPDNPGNWLTRRRRRLTCIRLVPRRVSSAGWIVGAGA
jgi:gamma-carbonic anhydrase